ncbi:MAG: iron-containing redox enzyme family protein [Deinococcota bacterium]
MATLIPPARYGDGLGRRFADGILTASQRDALDEKRQILLTHPLWQGLTTGTTSRAQLATFALQDAWLIREIHRLDGLAIAKAPDATSADYLIRKLTPKAGALDSLKAFGKALSLTEADFDSLEPLAGCTALTTQFYYQLARGSFVEVVAALSASETIFLEICGRIEQPLKEVYEFSDDELAFFSFHEVLETAEYAINDLLAHLVTTDAERDAAFAAMNLCYDCELLFYDTVLVHPHEFSSDV